MWRKYEAIINNKYVGLLSELAASEPRLPCHCQKHSRDFRQSMEFSMITYRSEVTNTIRAAKVQKNISWAEVAGAIGQSKEWTTAGCLGQMTFNKEQAEKIGAIFGLADEAVAWLQIAPYKGSLSAAVPADPLIYRWYAAAGH
jgi:hypothetical protein